MNHTPFRAPPFAARSVNRAIGDLRRGVAVQVEARGGKRFVALPADTATAQTLDEFRGSSASDPLLLLAPSRAADMQMSIASRSAALVSSAGSPDHRIDLAWVLLPVDTGSLDVESLRALADPTRQQALTSHRSAAPDLDSAPGQVGTDVAQAALLLAKLARLLPAMLVAEARVMDPGPTLLSVRAADILAYPAACAEGLVRAAEARVPLTEAEDARIVAFRPTDGGIEHLAILVGRPEDAATPLVRVHSECFTGDLLGSRRCDCGPQLHHAIQRMAAEGAGILLYMAQEGRGIGLVNKLRAYTLQDSGLDTLDANRALGFGADERSFAAAAAMLRQLGIVRIRLLTNNPDKIASLTAHGIEVTGRVSHAIAANGLNDGYLLTKALRFGHLLDG